MFQDYPQDIQQQQQQRSIESSPYYDDPYLLFDKFPGDHNSDAVTKNLVKSKSTPLPVEATSDLSKKEEAESQMNVEDIESPDSQNSKSRRMSLNKAERRAEHNAIERARRECLNSKFQQLAEVLPNLHNHRRPSKGQIVEKALDWVKQNMTKEDSYQCQIIQLQNENKRLMNQISIVQDQQQSGGIVSPTASCSSSSTSPATLSQRQIPAHSTPTTIGTPTPSTSASINSKLRNPSCYYSSLPADEMSPIFVNNAIGYGSQYNIVPNLAFKLDDNDSNSSTKDQQQLQMPYSDMPQVFDVNRALAADSGWTSALVPNHSISSDTAQYTYPIGHPMYTSDF
ncbi:hypothetical protein [Parasitella parasitica]|uniref:BHLH domain-containing protein n=1 Tax=Parasitella parasitica TaxID=35722 RepID=A0A0B7MZA0_9FUNG|nr:hypothetical protein [Parasitella parasitica]